MISFCNHHRDCRIGILRINSLVLMRQVGPVTPLTLRRRSPNLHTLDIHRRRLPHHVRLLVPRFLTQPLLSLFCTQRATTPIFRDPLTYLTVLKPACDVDKNATDRFKA